MCGYICIYNWWKLDISPTVDKRCSEEKRGEKWFSEIVGSRISATFLRGTTPKGSGSCSYIEQATAYPIRWVSTNFFVFCFFFLFFFFLETCW